jgi:hypothetical protein
MFCQSKHFEAASSGTEIIKRFRAEPGTKAEFPRLNHKKPCRVNNMSEPLADFWKRDAHDAAQRGIGLELRRRYGLLHDVPHQMPALVIQLSDDPPEAAFKVGQLHSATHHAFRKACRAMHIEVEEDRIDADFIFDKVIEAVKGGESDPEHICSRVVLELTEKFGNRPPHSSW